MKTQIFPGDYSPQDFYQLVIGSIGPRPIALISSVDNQGNKNLAPYSFFNIFSVTPFIVAFSTSLKSAPGKMKDTFRNVNETGECVINMVNTQIMHQMTICSADYPEDIDEFTKAGFTPLASNFVKPPAVLESYVNLECKVSQIIDLGSPPTGYLVLCEVVRMVINENVIKGNRIDPDAMDLIGRLGRNYYSKTDLSARLEIPRPLGHLPIGFDHLPDIVKYNNVLTGMELYRFAMQEKLEVLEFSHLLPDNCLSEVEYIDLYVRPLLQSDINLAYTYLFIYHSRKA